jgi:hypothetical protein
MRIKNFLNFAPYTVDIVDGRTYTYHCYALNQEHALDAASAIHIAARGKHTSPSRLIVTGPCHNNDCTLGEKCSMVIDRVEPDDLELAN